MPCVSVCVHGGAARGAHAAGPPARRLVNLVGFAVSVPKTTLTYAARNEPVLNTNAIMTLERG
eukprot:4418805-Prymnesium_polylepis.1